MSLSPSDGSVKMERRSSFSILAQATAKFLHDTVARAEEFATSSPDVASFNNNCYYFLMNKNNNNNNISETNSWSCSNFLPKSASSIFGGSEKSDTPWQSLSWFALYLDPGREHVLVNLHKQIRGRNRILASYRRIKNAMKDLQDSYVASKEMYNMIARYRCMKKMIKEVIILERQYWTLMSIPRKELSENQSEYVTKVLTHIDDRLKDDLPAQPAKGGISGLFGNAANLAERAKEAKHLDELKNKSTDELRKESEKIQGDIFRLSKKYSALRQVVAQLNTNFNSSKSYPIIPRYSMLKDMIKEALRAPAFVDICHEQEECT